MVLVGEECTVRQEDFEKKEERFWKILTIIISIIVPVLTYFDTKKSTENRIVEVLSERYESVDKEMSYEQALEMVDRDIIALKKETITLQSEKDDWQSKSEELLDEVDSLNKEIISLNNEINHSEKVAIAESYASTDDYKVAIPILDSIPEKTKDVVALLDDYTTKYEILVATNAIDLASNWNYEEAIILIDEALKVIPDSQMLIDKKKDIMPRYLVETIECYKAKNLWLLNDKEYIKMGGKSFKHAIYSQQSDIVNSMFNNAYIANAFYI